MEQEKQTRITLDSVINELQQEILKLEAEKMQVREEIESATFQAKNGTHRSRKGDAFTESTEWKPVEAHRTGPYYQRKSHC